MTQEIKCRDFDAVEKALLSPYTHINQVKGKQLSTKIILAFNYWLKVPQEMVNRIVDILDMNYSACLLYDDIQDNCMVRRGLPAAHCIYGVPLTMNACMHVFFLVFNKLMDLNVEAAKIYSKEFIGTIRGQGIDIYWRDNFVVPAESDHKEMVLQTVAPLFSLAVHIMQLFSEDKRDYADIISVLALYYQLRNDYCNLCHQEVLDEWPSAEEKQAQEMSFCEDLTEGNFTLPIIHGCKSPDGGKILNILRQRTRDVGLKKYCLSLLEKAGSLQYALDTLRALEKEIRDKISRLGGNPEMEALLAKLFI